MNPTNPPRPTSSPTSSQTRDDLPEVTSSLVPHPEGGRGHSRPSTPPTTTTTPPRPRDEVTRCLHCNAPIRETGHRQTWLPAWVHYDPAASYRDSEWEHCRTSTATPHAMDDRS